MEQVKRLTVIEMFCVGRSPQHHCEVPQVLEVSSLRHCELLSVLWEGHPQGPRPEDDLEVHPHVCGWSL